MFSNATRPLLEGFKKSIQESKLLHAFFEKYTYYRLCIIQRGLHAYKRISEPKDLISEAALSKNCYDLVCLIKTSTNLDYAQHLHCHILRSGFNSNVFVSTALLGFYMKYELFDEAHKVFVDILQPNVVSWNSLICGYVQSGQFRKALSLVTELERTDLQVDSFTITAALTGCAHLGFLDLGQSIHSKIVKLGLAPNIVVGNCLIDMYGKCGSVDEAIQVFYEMVNKDSVSWNSVIGASAGNRRLEEAFDFLGQIPFPDSISYNEVINGIAQFGHMEDAIQLFSEMPNPSSSSWNSIISGYVNRELVQEALDFFTKMHSEDIKMDQFTFSSILRGVAYISSLTWGSLIHCCTVKLGLCASLVVGSAQIDMYSKCGQVNNSDSIFNSLSKRNLVCWNAMISGYAHNGKTSKVIELFEQLKMEGSLEPDGITFLSVLSSCTQDDAQLQLGIHYFESMIREYRIIPTTEHCTCMIRLLGRIGEIRRAERMIHEMGFGSCGFVWRALLGACCDCGDLKVAEVAAAKLIELDGDDKFVYVILSNMYASFGRWRDVSVVRRLMAHRGLRKEAGCSWIEVENVVPACSIDES